MFTSFSVGFNPRFYSFTSHGPNACSHCDEKRQSLKITVWGQLAYGVSFPKFYAKYRVDDFIELQGNWLQGQILQLLTIFIELE